MKKLSRRICQVIGAAALSALSAYSYAVDCPGSAPNDVFYHTSTGTPPITTTITVAVASNFRDAAIDLADRFVVGTSYKVNLCHNSSGSIAPSITGGNPYDVSLFLSADQGYAQAIVTAGVNIGSPFLYAYGLPIWLLSPAAYTAASGDPYPAASYLNQNVVPGAPAQATSGHTITNDVTLKHSSGTPAVPTIAIGNVPNAPYGVAASLILDDMNQWNGGNDRYNAGSNIATPCATLIATFGTTNQWQCEYSNIDVTLEAIQNNAVTGGVVGLSQVCLDPSTYPLGRYVKFPTYFTSQYGILVNVTDSAEEAVAASLVSFMGTTSPNAVGPLGVSWNTFLTNYCYNTL